MTDYRNFDEAFALTNRLRTEGTDHLLEAARAAGGAAASSPRASATGTTSGAAGR